MYKLINILKCFVYCTIDYSSIKKNITSMWNWGMVDNESCDISLAYCTDTSIANLMLKRATKQLIGGQYIMYRCCGSV